MPTCKACGAHIVFVKTKAGKTAPVEKQQGGNVILQASLLADEPAMMVVVAHGKGTHVSHFATCPSAASFRRKT